MALNTSYAINIFPLQSLDDETAETGEGRSNERSQDYDEGKARLQAATDPRPTIAMQKGAGDCLQAAHRPQPSEPRPLCQRWDGQSV